MAAIWRTRSRTFSDKGRLGLSGFSAAVPLVVILSFFGLLSGFCLLCSFGRSSTIGLGLLGRAPRHRFLVVLP